MTLDFDNDQAWPAYDWMGVAKSALESVTRYLARDLGGYGIRVNAVGPGSIDTEMMAGVNANPEAMKMVLSRTPLKRIGAPREVADVVAFLASDKASYITGETMTIEPSGLTLKAWEAGVYVWPTSAGWNPTGVKLTPRLAAKLEVARSAARATTPSTNRRLLIRTPFRFAGRAGGNTPKSPVTDPASLKVWLLFSVACSVSRPAPPAFPRPDPGPGRAAPR